MKFLTPEEIQNHHDLVKKSSTFKNLVQNHDLQNKRVLDMGCGYGSYMQSFGADSVGITTIPHEVEFGAANDIDIRLGNVELLSQALDDTTDTFDAFWANNLFEHLLSPHGFLVRLKEYAKDDALLILGVPMIPAVPQLMKIKKFRGALASPHINFFTKDTFIQTVKFAGWDVLSCRSYFFTSKTLDAMSSRFVPHLYITARNNADYQYPKKKVKEWEHDSHYTDLLDIMNSK